MAEFLTTNGTSYYIEKIITSAKSKLVIVSPYLSFSKTFYERLKDACSRNVEINIIFGKTELNEEQRSLLYNIKNLKLYFFENLHAKCYFNESIMIVTSMNMYEFSEKNNREMGILINKDEDEKIYIDAVEEVFSIVNSSEQTELNAESEEIAKDNYLDRRDKGSKNRNSCPEDGYCIRCHSNLDYNFTRPLCRSCFDVWVMFSDPFYEENYCHQCGEESDYISMDKPECYHCYKKRKDWEHLFIM